MRTGRPKLPDEERKDNVLRIRLTDDERRTLDSAAASAEDDTSSWARVVLLKAAKREHGKNGERGN